VIVFDGPFDKSGSVSINLLAYMLEKPHLILEASGEPIIFTHPPPDIL